MLVVDDEDLVLRLAKPALERYGYKVLTALNGEIALGLITATSGRTSRDDRPYREIAERLKRKGPGKEEPERTASRKRG